MGNKSIILICILVSAILMGASQVQGQLGLGDLLGIIRIQGTVFCTANGNIGINGTSTPVFPNALVQLRCGNGVVSSVSTNNAGIFSILLNPLQFLPSTILSNCNVVVNTPLSSCNANLPSVGGLLSPLQFIGNTVLGLLSIVINIVPVGFQFLASVN